MVWKGFKFPEEPPQINPDDKYEDPVALIEYREWALRRKYVDIEKAKVCATLVLQRYGGITHSCFVLLRCFSLLAQMPKPAYLIRWPCWMQLLREKVKHCYVTEGVNHYQNCRELVARYLDSIKNIGVHVANAGPNDLGRAEEKARVGA